MLSWLRPPLFDVGELAVLEGFVSYRFRAGSLEVRRGFFGVGKLLMPYCKLSRCMYDGKNGRLKMCLFIKSALKVVVFRRDLIISRAFPR